MMNARDRMLQAMKALTALFALLIALPAFAGDRIESLPGGRLVDLTYAYDENNQVVVDSSQRQQVDDFEKLILEDKQYIELVYREIA